MPSAKTLPAIEEGRILHEGPMELGGERVVSYLPDDYSGPCAITCAGNGELIGVAADPEVALRIGRYATTPDGGFGSVDLEPSSKTPDYQSLSDFI